MILKYTNSAVSCRVYKITYTIKYVCQFNIAKLNVVTVNTDYTYPIHIAVYRKTNLLIKH